MLALQGKLKVPDLAERFGCSEGAVYLALRRLRAELLAQDVREA